MTGAVSPAREAKVTGAQIRAARALLKLSQRELSRLSRVSSLTIVRIEASDGPATRRAGLVAAIVAALSRQGIEFVSAKGIGIGVCLKPQRQEAADERSS
jgi:transcriptional regulator with XRE-family HTH domain